MSMQNASLEISWKCATTQMPALAALLFDLDGTLVDTMPLHYQAYARVFSRYGGTFRREDFDRLIGPPAAITVPQFARAAGLDSNETFTVAQVHAEKKSEFEHILKSARLDLLPAASLLRANHGDFQIAVVTSGNARGARAILEASGLWTHVEVLVSGDDVLRGKPDPEPYQLALSRLGKESKHGLAFEDHDNGIQSATCAGVPVIDVRTGRLIPAVCRDD